MFTLFNPAMAELGRRVVEEHRAFHDGLTGPEAITALQTERLRATLSYARENSPFYRKRLSHLEADQIAALGLAALDPGALDAHVPFTTKADLREQLFDLPAKPVHEAWIYYETTGTTGRATPCPRDNTDSLVNNAALTFCYQDVFDRHGTEHVVAVLGPTELHSTGDTFGEVCRNLGHAVVKMWPHSPVVGFRRALEVLRELSVTAVFCTPGMAISLAKQARAQGLDPARDFSIRMFMFTGELATPQLLAGIGAHWNAQAYNCLYASQEASILGAVSADGRLRTVPLNVYYEVIDPDSGRPAREADGARQGELVVTHLYQGSKPLIRYRTGDLVRLTPADRGGPYPSPILLPLGRVRDQLPIGDGRRTAYELESEVLRRLPDCLDYQIVIDAVDGVDELTVRVETKNTAVSPAEQEERLNGELGASWGCRFRVEAATLGAITTTGAMVSWKAARVHDRRVDADCERDAALAIAGHREAR